MWQPVHVAACAAEPGRLLPEGTRGGCSPSLSNYDRLWSSQSSCHKVRRTARASTPLFISPCACAKGWSSRHKSRQIWISGIKVVVQIVWSFEKPSLLCFLMLGTHHDHYKTYDYIGHAYGPLPARCYCTCSHFQKKHTGYAFLHLEKTLGWLHQFVLPFSAFSVFVRPR